MIRNLVAAALASATFAVPAHAGRLELGVLDCTIDGGQAYVIASHKGVSCIYRPSNGSHPELYTGVISKLGVDLGTTNQGQLVWAVLAATRDYDPGSLAGKYYGVNAEASIATGGGEVAQRTLLNYQRGEEMAADRSAINYLNATGQSGKGMLKTFQRFQSALSLSGAQIDPYRISHPMPQDRIANLKTLIEKSPFYGKTDPEALQQRHDMMRVKIAAYMQGQAAVSRLIRKKPDSLSSRYGEALSAYLFGNPSSAMARTEALVKAQPRNPYFQELRGDILMKINKPKEAAAAYGRAVSLDPAKSGLLMVSQGQALMAVGTPAALKEAVAQINNGLERDRENAAGYRYLAQAYGELGDIPRAELATAEGHYYSGAYQDAKIFAARAQRKFKRGEPGWLRAQDIINFRAPGKNQ